MTHDEAQPRPEPIADSRTTEPHWIRNARLAVWPRNLPVEAILVGLGLFVLLVAFVSADPSSHATFSVAPFTDEAGNLVNARNFVQLGSWSTDQWNLYLVNLPFSLVEAVTFQATGVGIVQARLAMIVCASLTATVLVWGLRDTVGRVWASFAGLAFGASGLILFYGRLAFLEDLVVLGLTAGTLVLARQSRINLRGGAAAGLGYAIAIGTKPSALFAVAGILVTMALIWGWRDRAMRRWLLGATAVIAAAGVVWAVAIWIPNRDAVAIDLKIWPPYQWNLTPIELLTSIKRYLGNSDSVIGVMLLPLLVLGSMGVAAIVVLRQRLTESEARLAAASFGWAAFGFGILMVASYRPNRYVVPLVPSLAILAAIGLHLFAGAMQERLAGWRTSDDASTATSTNQDAPYRRARRLAPGLVAVAAIVIAVAPGLVWYGSWARSARHDLVSIQSQFANVVPADQTVVGSNSALLLMRSKARTVIDGLANNGDLYAEGTRWYLLPSDASAPTGVPASAWANRKRVVCTEWRAATVCVFHVP